MAETFSISSDLHLSAWWLANCLSSKVSIMQGFFAWETVFHELSQRYHLGTEAEASEAEKSQQCYKKKKECHGDLFLLT